MKNVIELSNVGFSFGKIRALSAITFSIKKGDFVEILGPNGSGKTTLIRLILRLLRPTAGKIKILGRDINNFSDWSKIGYVPQKATHIDPNFPATSCEIVGMGLLSSKTIPRMMTENDEIKIKNAIAAVEMAPYAHRRFGELSGGQQQRIAIARAIVSNPEIIILDEPTSGIDIRSQARFYSLLQRLNQKGITIIIASHDMGKHVMKCINKVVSLNQRLEFFGSHEEYCKKYHRHHLREG